LRLRGFNSPIGTVVKKHPIIPTKKEQLTLQAVACVFACTVFTFLIATVRINFTPDDARVAEQLSTGEDSFFPL